MAQVDPASTGLNPAWRTALMHVVASKGWPEGSCTAYINELRDKLKAELAELEALSPGAGAYFNEVSYPIRSYFITHKLSPPGILIRKTSKRNILWLALC